MILKSLLEVYNQINVALGFPNLIRLRVLMISGRKEIKVLAEDLYKLATKSGLGEFSVENVKKFDFSLFIDSHTNDIVEAFCRVA